MKHPLLKRRPRADRPDREPQDLIQRLENRILFAHLGHEVTLPAAASHGQQGLEAAIAAPGDHRRSRLVTSS